MKVTPTDLLCAVLVAAAICAALLASGCARREAVLIESGTGFARVAEPTKAELWVPVDGGEYEQQRGVIPAGWYVMEPPAEPATDAYRETRMRSGHQ